MCAVYRAYKDASASSSIAQPSSGKTLEIPENCPQCPGKFFKVVGRYVCLGRGELHILLHHSKSLSEFHSIVKDTEATLTDMLDSDTIMKPFVVVTGR